MSLDKINTIDKAICDWSMSMMHSLSDQEQTSLLAKIFNTLYADGNIHTMPDDGIHIESEHCWCSPVRSFVNAVTGFGQFAHTDTRKEALN